jgi:hypothetical protein
MSQKGPSWENRASRLLKSELKRADVTYDELAGRLKKQGLRETKASIANKLSRGTFPTSFFLASMSALDKGSVRLDDE